MYYILCYKMKSYCALISTEGIDIFAQEEIDISVQSSERYYQMQICYLLSFLYLV